MTKVSRPHSASVPFWLQQLSAQSVVGATYLQGQCAVICMEIMEILCQAPNRLKILSFYLLPKKTDALQSSHAMSHVKGHWSIDRIV